MPRQSLMRRVAPKLCLAALFLLVATVNGSATPLTVGPIPVFGSGTFGGDSFDPTINCIFAFSGSNGADSVSVNYQGNCGLGPNLQNGFEGFVFADIDGITINSPGSSAAFEIGEGGGSAVISSGGVPEATASLISYVTTTITVDMSEP